MKLKFGGGGGIFYFDILMNNCQYLEYDKILNYCDDSCFLFFLINRKLSI